MPRILAQNLVKGDIIIERVNGKNRMTPVRQLELNACSSRDVHVNRNACYDSNAWVDVADGDGNLRDLEAEVSGLGDLEEDWKEIETLGKNPHLKHVHIPNGVSAEELAELLVKQ